jgi:hypothetical protein
MVTVHPHQYLWFNQVIGGLPGAFLKYDTDYYGNTYKEGFATLREILWETDRERFLERPYIVSACMPDFVADQYLGANFERKRRGGKAEFWLGYTRNNCYLQNERAPEFAAVERHDTLLLLIRDLRAMPDKRKNKPPAKPKPKPKPPSKPSKSKTEAKADPKAEPSDPKVDPNAPTGLIREPRKAPPSRPGTDERLGPSE